MESLRFAIVGLTHGASHIPSFEAEPRARLVAVVDTQPDKAQTTAERAGVEAFTDMQQLLDAGVADAAIIAVPTHLHAPMSIECLNAGLHVLQEKNLCRTLDEAKAIREAITRNGKTFQVGFEYRSSALHASIMDHIHDGDLGRVTNLWYCHHTKERARTTEVAWRAARSNWGGKFFDCSCHALNLIRAWAGAPIHRLSALGNRLGEIGPYDGDLPQSVAVSIEYQNGVRGTFNFGAANDFRNDVSFGIAGTTGRILGDPFYPDGAGSYELRTHRGARVGQLYFDSTLTSPGHIGFVEQLQRFVATILDDAPNVCSFEDGYDTLRTLMMLDRALASGQTVIADDLPEPIVTAARASESGCSKAPVH